jgi:hypothetical protein
MSLITHRCTVCEHPDFWRFARPPGRQNTCPQCGDVCKPGNPELVPTFDVAGREVERITVPGKATGFQVTTCNCKACKALYEQLTGAAA